MEFVLYFRLALYVYEYLLHVGAQKAAQTFLSEVSIADFIRVNVKLTLKTSLEEINATKLWSMRAPGFPNAELAFFVSNAAPHSRKEIEAWEREIDPRKSLFFYWKISVFRVQNLFY